MQTKSDERRSTLLAQVAELDLSVTVLERHQPPGESDADARAMCLAAMVRRLASLEASVTLLIKSRGDRDAEDHKTIGRSRSSAAVLDYQHIDPATDPLIWLANCFVWPIGATRSEPSRSATPSSPGHARRRLVRPPTTQR